MALTGFDLEQLLDSETGGTNLVPFVEQGYTGTTDYRIRQLSYSSLLTLHSCPRKFQLYRLRTTHRAEEDEKSTITFSFGHVIGTAIQAILSGSTLDEVILGIFLEWHAPFLSVDEKSHKSIWYAIFAIQKFAALREAGLLNDYELVYYNDRPACELSFSVIFPDGFRLRGFVDAVLRHIPTGRIVVLEVKTTNSASLDPAKYKNSAQAIGYSIVLDNIFPDLSDYQVLYFIYQTKDKEYSLVPFTKTYLQRALWIRELLLDIETIKMYEEAGIYPMRGESCFSFSRPCEYFNTCELGTAYLTKPCTAEEEDKADYQITLTLQDLLETQFKKLEAPI